MSVTVFSIRGLPAPMSRNAYLVVDVWQPAPVSWRAEYHILTRRPHEHLISDSINVEVKDRSSDDPPIDQAYMLTEARQQADIALLDVLDDIAAERGDPELGLAPVSFVDTTISLNYLWLQGVYKLKILDIAAVTESPALKRHLAMVTQPRTLRPS